MGKYDHIGLTLDESLSGWVAMGCKDPVEGRLHGQVRQTRLVMRSHLCIDSLSRFLEQPDHACRLDGTISFSPLGDDMTMREGVFNVFVVDPRTGERQMVYETLLTGADDDTYFLRGVKHVHDDPGFDVVEDMTTLFVTIHRGEDDRGEVVAAGQVFFALADIPSFVASMDVTGEAWFGQELAAKIAFVSFCFGQVRDAYLADLNPLYKTSYQNVVIDGQMAESGGPPQRFFLVSGIHAPGFPWGDGETFCDVLLAVGDPDGDLHTHAISARRLDDQVVDIQNGSLEYEGPLFEVTGSEEVRFSDMNCDAPAPTAHDAKVSLRFQAATHPLAPFPFRINNEVLDRLAYQARETLRHLLPSEGLFGFAIEPHSVDQVTGTISLHDGAHQFQIETAATLGEAENSTISNVREPTLLYGYICAIRRAARAARVQFHTSSLRNEREYWGKDRFDALFGAVISRFASKDLDIRPDGVTVTDLADPLAGASPPALFERVGPPLLDVRNDHFPTAVFQRRIIRVKDPSGETCLALEEAMDTLRRAAVNHHGKVVVASVRHDDAKAALETALADGLFWKTLEDVRVLSGKDRADLSIVIKPNFMFAYNKRDRSTFTDPALVEHLVGMLRHEGYRNITLVEAQSTYGQYFANRGVRDVAAYLEYAVDESRGYRVVDLTEDDRVSQHFGPALGYHPVPVTWRDADFRISFAKNKTHCYAFYTLTLKNIYGALALADKFREYHCDRGIYATTMEYLRAYPVHYGIVDAWLSADGPFGIFADSEPNRTHTVLAGPNLVAVDWVGASKMGMDPKISRFMKLALDTFGKPEIEVKGDATVYHPWLNVPMALSLLTNFGLDANHYFGNLFYMSGAYMDDKQFPFKSRSAFIRAVRQAMRPIQQAVFLTPEGHRTRANKVVGDLMRWLGS